MSHHPEHAIDNIQLLQRLIDARDELTVLYRQNELILVNAAFQTFFGTNDLGSFLREYGALHNCFVPHNAYFHATDLSDETPWFEAILVRDAKDRIVSMIDTQPHPHAFSVDVDTSVEGYAIIAFTDISRDLIKCIMSENDADMDKESGAYDRQYFVHTSDSFIDAAAFNHKIIGTTLILLPENHANVRNVATNIKAHTRQDDMLVRWGNDSFILIYLTDCEHHALRLSHKLVESAGVASSTIRIVTTVQQERDTIESMIGRCERITHDTLNETIRIV